MENAERMMENHGGKGGGNGGTREGEDRCGEGPASLDWSPVTGEDRQAFSGGEGEATTSGRDFQQCGSGQTWTRGTESGGEGPASGWGRTCGDHCPL